MLAESSVYKSVISGKCYPLLFNLRFVVPELDALSEQVLLPRQLPVSVPVSMRVVEAEPEPKLFFGR